MSEQEKKGMPFPTPSLEGDGDNEHLLHQQASGPVDTIAAMQLSALGFEGFGEMARLKLEPATAEALKTAIGEAMTTVTKIMSGVPNPDGVDEEPASAEMVYMPYVMLVGLQLMALAGSQALTEGSMADRYTWISEFVRAWCSFGAVSAVRRAGITDMEQIRNIEGIAVMQQPMAMGMLAMLSEQRRLLREEADARGISMEAVLKEKAAAVNAEDDDRPQLVM